jgi:SAM-dependent methyltransferase
VSAPRRTAADPETDPAQAARGEAPWHDLECGAYTADLALWRELAAAAGPEGSCKVLELGCGTGRVSLALAGNGCVVTAIDAEAELVDVLRQRAVSRALEVEVHVADVRSFDLRRRFDLVLAPMQLVQLLGSRRERARMLRRVAAHLEPRGLAAFAMLAPSLEPFEAEQAPPMPDMREVGGWVFSSQPVAIRPIEEGAAIELERIRQAVSPRGEIVESVSRVVLQVLDAAGLEEEAAAAGLRQLERREIPATRDHVASSVVIVRRDG